MSTPPMFTPPLSLTKTPIWEGVSSANQFASLADEPGSDDEERELSNEEPADREEEGEPAVREEEEEEASGNAADDQTTPGTPLFVPIQPPLLPAPGSTPPRPPKARRKTLAGVTDFQLARSSPRLRANNRNLPIAQLAEQLLCRRLGIVGENEPVTEAAIGQFVALFSGRLPDIAISALRVLFRLDCDFASAVEEALMEHGGQDTVEHQAATAEIEDLEA